MISIIIPVYNEEAVLWLLHERLANVANAWTKPFEVILVNDGSADRSLEILLEIHRKDPRFKVVDLSRNFGHQAALSVGLSCAAGECVLVLDADLQDPPEIINQFLQKWQEGYDIVYGVRTRRPEGWLKRFLYYAYYRILQRLAYIKIPLDVGDFCLMSRQVVTVLNSLPERVRFTRGLRSWAGFKQVGIPYERESRRAGVSNYSWRKLVRLGLSGIVSFSKFPLRMASILGLMMAGLALTGSFIFLLLRITGWTPFGYSVAQSQGLTTLIISLFFLSGIQLICLGIMGEYLAQVVEEVKGRPVGVIRETYGIEIKQSPPFILHP
jgi:glycosyltransferase involved in cell wall biosynthesis